MEPKKNPKADLTKNSGMYFVIGLAVVMLIIWRALEWKTYDEQTTYDVSMNVEDMLDEELKQALEKDLPKIPYVFISSLAQIGLVELKDLIWKELNP